MKKMAFYLFSLSIILAILSTVAFRSANECRKTYSDTDSLEADRLKYMNRVMESIKGKEKLPADSVFKNLKVIIGKGSISAEHLLWMMNYGWSAELGVSCSHCHVLGRWESDSLETKQIARGMW